MVLDWLSEHTIADAFSDDRSFAALSALLRANSSSFVAGLYISMWAAAQNSAVAPERVAILIASMTACHELSFLVEASHRNRNIAISVQDAVNLKTFCLCSGIEITSSSDLNHAISIDFGFVPTVFKKFRGYMWTRSSKGDSQPAFHPRLETTIGRVIEALKSQNPRVKRLDFERAQQFFSAEQWHRFKPVEVAHSLEIVN